MKFLKSSHELSSRTERSVVKDLGNTHFMYSRFFGRSSQQPVFLPPVVWMTIDNTKGETLQTIYSLNSSSTIPKSCTTFGRRNYLLRLSQIFKNQCHPRRRGSCRAWKRIVLALKYKKEEWHLSLLLCFIRTHVSVSGSSGTSLSGHACVGRIFPWWSRRRRRQRRRARMRWEYCWWVMSRWCPRYLKKGTPTNSGCPNSIQLW